MVTNTVSEVTKWRMCRDICDKYHYFIVDKSDYVLLYRKGKPYNSYVGRRKTITAMLALVKKVTGFV